MTRPELKLKKQRKTGTTEDAMLIQWRALKAGEEALYYAGKMGNSGGVLSAIHAITQAAGAYGRLIETGELQETVAALVEELAAVKASMGSAPMRKVA